MTEVPTSVRIPLDRAPNHDGQALNVGIEHIDVPVVIDPDLPTRGECQNGYGGPVIALREWDEQVFLHELLHAATGYAQPLLVTTHPPHGHEVISRVEVALWETGWRFQPALTCDHEAQIRDLLEEREELLTEIRRLRMGRHPAGRALRSLPPIEPFADALAEALTERDAEHEGGEGA